MHTYGSGHRGVVVLSNDSRIRYLQQDNCTFVTSIYVTDMVQLMNAA